MAASDTTLLKRWIDARDAEAFKAVCEKYAGLPYAVSLRILGDAAEAQDVTQECFEGLAGLSRAPKGHLGPWLHQVATYRALNRRRGARRRGEREQEFARRLEPPREPAWDDIYGHVDAAIAELPVKLRTAVVAHFLENQTHEAIAKREGVSRAAITQRIQRGIGHIRQSLRGRGVEVGGGALAALFHAHLAEAAPVPPAVHLSLGKIALSGAMPRAATVPGLLGGLMTAKSAITAAAACAALAVGLIFAFQTFRGATDVPPPPAPEADEWKPEAVRSAPDSPAPPIAEVAEVSIASGGTVSGRVYEAATGAGIANVPVRAVVEGAEAGGEGPRALSAEDGAYTLVGLAKGTYTIGLEPPVGYQPPADPRARTVRMESDTAMAGCDFALLYEVPLSGVVVDTAEVPVPGAEVYIRSEIFRNPVGRRRSVTADSEGRFAFHNLVPAGTLSLQATDGIACSPLAVVDLLEAGAEGLVLKLEPAASIAGRVVDPEGRPVPGIKFRMEHLTSGRHWFISQPPVTDGQGRFAMAPLAAGKYKITLRRDSDMPTIHGGDKERGAVVHLAEGEQKRNIELVYDRVYTISGTVRSEGGRFLEGLAVSARASGLGGAQAVTDASGAFTIADLPAGEFDVVVSRRAFLLCEPLAGVPAGTDGLAITVPDMNELSGRVTSARTGMPVAEFEIYVDIKGEPANAFSNWRDFVPYRDRNGEFAHPVNVTGAVTVAVRATGFLPASRQVMIPPHGGNVDAILFALEDSRFLEGIVVDASGAAVSGAQIFTGGGDQLRGAEPAAVSDGEGNFTLRTVPPESFPLTAAAEGYAPASIVVDSAASQPAPVRLVMTVGGRLEGTVYVEGNEPLPGVAVQAEPRDGAYPAPEVLAGEDGAYRIGGLADGLYTVRIGLRNASGTGYRALLREAEIRNGLTTQLDVLLPEGTATVTGRIHDGTVAGVKGEVTLRLTASNGEELELFSLADGAGYFHIDGVPAGKAEGTATIRTTGGGEQTLPITPFDVEPGASVDLDLMQ